MSTAIKPWRWFNRNQEYIMTLDCDSLSDCLAATHVLKLQNIGIAIIQSSIDHYWIITDKIGKFKELIGLMEEIPRVDVRYISVCTQRSVIALRAIPYNLKIPVFQDHHTLTNPRVIEWYEQFKFHYNNDMMSKVIDNIRILKALKEGNMMTLASDPTFIV